jgi:diguanylate cyclase (GGDEF)-like protein
LLREVAQRLSACVRETDTVARIGGDEFAVLIHPEPGDDLREIAYRMVRVVEAPVPVEGGGSARVGASVGVATATSQTTDGESLLREADAAMYLVKRDGKGSYALAGSSAVGFRDGVHVSAAQPRRPHPAADPRRRHR